MSNPLAARIAMFLGLGAGMLVIGCAKPVKSFAPLIDDGHLVSDQKIAGTWVHSEESGQLKIEVAAMQYQVMDADTGKTHAEQSSSEEEKAVRGYRVIFTTPNGKNEYHARLGRWGKEEFAEVEPLAATHGAEPAPNPLLVAARSFCKVRIEGDVLRLAYMDGAWAREHIPKDKQIDLALSNQPDTGGEGEEPEIVFIGSPKELREFVLKNAANGEAFSEVRFAREGTLAAEHQALEVKYAAAATEAEKHAQYEEAASAWGHLAELRPQLVPVHYELGMALLGNNELVRARDAFSEALKSCQSQPPASAEEEPQAAVWCAEEAPADLSFAVGLSYFLADQPAMAIPEFEKAIQADLENYKRDSGTGGGLESRAFQRTLRHGFEASEHLVWESLAMREVGKKAQARKLLRDAETRPDKPVFGAAVDYLQGKMTEAELIENVEHSTSCEPEFVLASQALRTGDKAKARTWFEKAAGENQCSSEMSVAISARRKQLNAK